VDGIACSDIKNAISRPSFLLEASINQDRFNICVGIAFSELHYAKKVLVCQSTMPPKFASSTFRPVLEQSLLDPDPKVHSVGWNLIHDWRIGSERLADFSASTSICVVPSTFTDVQRFGAAFDAFHHKTVVSPPLDPAKVQTCPAFIVPGKNDTNIYGHPFGPVKLADDLLLVTVTPLARLDGVFRSAAANGIPEFKDRDIPIRGLSRPLLIDWLDGKLASLDPAVPWENQFLKAQIKKYCEQRIDINEIFESFVI
jgi:hypothetical protein